MGCAGAVRGERESRAQAASARRIGRARVIGPPWLGFAIREDPDPLTIRIKGQVVFECFSKRAWNRTRATRRRRRRRTPRPVRASTPITRGSGHGWTGGRGRATTTALLPLPATPDALVTGLAFLLLARLVLERSAQAGGLSLLLRHGGRLRCARFPAGWDSSPRAAWFSGPRCADRHGPPCGRVSDPGRACRLPILR